MQLRFDWLGVCGVISGMSFVMAREYCETDTFSAACSEHEVIQVQTGVYGRMRENRCVREDRALGCSAQVVHVMDKWCSGRPKCSFPVSNILHEITSPCDMDYRGYLDAEYTCVAVYIPPAPCHGIMPVTVNEKQPLLLSSFVAMETKCGRYDNPHLLRTESGRQLNITLYDYNANVEDGMAKFCSVYATITENNGIGARSVCGGVTPYSHVLTSLTNQIELRFGAMVTQFEDPPIFLLKVTAIGCPNPILNQHTIFNRFGNEAEITCPGSDVIHRLLCNGSDWSDTMHNCSVRDHTQPEIASSLNNSILSRDHSLWTVVLVALCVGAAVLTTGIVCIKRRAQQSHSAQNHDPYWSGQTAHMQYGPPTKPMDYMTSQDNTYDRTWQLKQNQHQYERNHIGSPPDETHRHLGGYHGNNHMPVDIHQIRDDQFQIGYSDEFPNKNKTNYIEESLNSSFPTPPPYVSTPGNGTQRRYVEHIYESPKFERVQHDSVEHGRLSSMGSYFEVDQTATISNSKDVNN